MKSSGNALSSDLSNKSKDVNYSTDKETQEENLNLNSNSSSFTKDLKDKPKNNKEYLELSHSGIFKLSHSEREIESNLDSTYIVDFPIHTHSDKNEFSQSLDGSFHN